MLETYMLYAKYAAAIMSGLAFLVYMYQTRENLSNPNAVSWFIWALTATIHAASYFGLSTDAKTPMVFYTGSVGCILTFLYALIWGHFEKPSAAEARVLAVSLLAVAVWWIFKSAEYATVILAGGFILSFGPTIAGVQSDPWKEKALPWYMWTVGFSIQLVVIILALYLQQETAWGLISPIVLAALHGWVAVLCRKKRKQAFPKPAVA